MELDCSSQLFFYFLRINYDQLYKIKQKIGLFFISLLISINLTAQEGIVKFAVDVDNGYFEILINDTLLLKRYKDTLAVGVFKATIWSLTYEEGVLSYIAITTDSEVLEGYKEIEKNNPMSGFVIDGYNSISIDWKSVNNRLQNKMNRLHKVYELSEENNPLHDFVGGDYFGYVHEHDDQLFPFLRKIFGQKKWLPKAKEDRRKFTVGHLIDCIIKGELV